MMHDRKVKSVFVVGLDSSVDQMFKAEGWDLVKDPNFADFICFTGGSDVSPELYGETNNGLSFVNKARDAREMNIYNQFKGHVGFLGICRGGQFLNVMNGGKLRQHIDPDTHHGIRDCRTVTRARTRFTERIQTQQDHHQAILPTNKARTFLVDDTDGVVEGCWYEATKSFCFQPHPEWGHEPTRKVFFAWIHNFFSF